MDTEFWGQDNMNTRIREFFERLILLINEFSDVPIEAKRLALYVTFDIVEKQSNEAIEIEKEESNAESIPEDKLEKLSK